MTADNPGNTAPLFLLLIQCLSRMDQKTLTRNGIDPETVKLLLSLTVEEQLQLAQSADFFMTFSIDVIVLVRMLQRARQHISQERLVDDLTIWGATQRFMYDWFGLSPYDFKMRAERVKAKVRRGRTQVRLKDAIEQKILKSWCKHSAVEQPRRQLLVAQELELPVATIDAIVRPGEASPHARQQPSPSGQVGNHNDLPCHSS